MFRVCSKYYSMFKTYDIQKSLTQYTPQNSETTETIHTCTFESI